jgi:hypothetical protein
MFFVGFIAQQAWKTKNRLDGHRVGLVFGSVLGSPPWKGSAHPSFRSIHRGRSRPGWRSRLVKSRLVPDATTNVRIVFRPSRLFSGNFRAAAGRYFFFFFVSLACALA